MWDMLLWGKQKGITNNTSIINQGRKNYTPKSVNRKNRNTRCFFLQEIQCEYPS